MANVYRPTAQARLQLRLDEGATSLAGSLLRGATDASSGVAIPATTEGIDGARKGNRESRILLGQSRGNLSDTEYQREKARLEAEARELDFARFGGKPRGAGLPNAIKSKDTDDKNVLFTALPMTVEIERTNIREPSTCEITFDYRDLPMDPRCVRACFMSVTIGSVSADEYMRGIVLRETRRESDGMLVSIVERRQDEELQFSGSKTRFTGFVDEWKISLTDDGDTVTLTLRDLTALLIDQKLPPGICIDMGLPIVDGITGLLENFPSMRGLQIFFGTPAEFDASTSITDKKGPTPASAMPEVAKSRGGKKAKAQKQGDKEDNVWDHIVTTCAKLGLIPMIRGFVLFILEPRSLFSQAEQGRRMVYGRNIRKLDFARKLTGVTTQTVEARSYDPDIGRTRWARYPVMPTEPSAGILGDPKSPQPVMTRAQKVSPSGETEEQVLTISVPRVTDLVVLQNIAANYFQEMARQEIEGNFETDDLDSFKEEDSEFGEQDLLDLYPGDSVTLLYAPPDTSAQGNPFQVTEKAGKRSSSSAQEYAAMSFARRMDYLSGLGMSAETAKRIAAATENIPLANSFKVGTTQISFDIDDGVSIACSFYNFITIRELGPTDPASVERQAATSIGELGL